MKKLLFIAVTLMTIASCSKSDSGSSNNTTPTPTVSFTYTRSSTIPPSTVQFTSTVTNATSYSWNFGDGSSSSVANPSHTYTSAQDYAVTLTVTGTGGSATASNTVSISAPTSVKITAVKITKFPVTTSTGGSWDVFPNSGADLFIRILNNTTILYDYPSYYTDVISSDLPLLFTLKNSANVATPLIINSADFSISKTISLYDYDGSLSPDHISDVIFKPSSHTTGTTAYPTTLALTNSSNDTNIILTLLWQ